MKYTIEGFSQRNAIAMKLSIDDLIFLRWFIDFKEKGEMKDKYIQTTNTMGYWVSYKYVMKELPILFSQPPHISNDNYSNFTFDEKKKANKNWITACKKKLQRMLSGNLSKVLNRDIEKEKSNNEKGQNQINSYVYLHINKTTYKFLTSDSYGIFVDNIEIPVDNKENIVDNIITGQKCPSEKPVTTGHFCPPVTTGQKCPVYPSTNILYSSISFKPKSEDFSATYETHPNVKLFRQKTGLKNKGKDFYEKLIKWDYEKLITSLELFSKRNGNSFEVLKLIYNDNSNFKVTKNNNFRNFTETYTQYTEDEFEDLVEKVQRAKFK